MRQSDDFSSAQPANDCGYDVHHDMPLIEASFAAQYGIRLRHEPHISWGEFSRLLAGLMPETPLGRIVSVRLARNTDRLRKLSAEDRRIRAEWLRFRLSQKPAQADISSLQQAFEACFGRNEKGM